jgi:tRNA modification GTPase
VTAEAHDTIFALSTGAPPAAIAVVRVSGPAAGAVLKRLAGSVPVPRVATFARISDGEGETLDRGLVLWLPGPGSSTGEDVAELHLHGGRAVVAGVLETLARLPGLRPAEPGEFTRRSFENGRIDLAEAEGLADLLAAETQSQRRAAQALAGGGLSRLVEAWQARVLRLAAEVEAVLDFSDEGDVGDEAPGMWAADVEALVDEVEAALSRPGAERLREGVRVVIAGPPNSGKSSLLNWLAGRQAAITSAIAGTTRDLVEAPTAIGGAPFLLVDTAGLRDSDDEVESIGIGRARESMAAADLVLWLGAPAECPEPDRSIMIQSKADLVAPDASADIRVSSETGEGMEALITLLIARARALLPQEGEVALNGRHRQALAAASEQLREARGARDMLIAAECLRQARVALDRVTGRAGVSDMLSMLFGRFCIGK